jgi:sugar phosphate isomerase/epimerase
VKLALLTYNMARTLDLPKLVELARQGGFAGIEFRAEANHAHGVELDTSPAQRLEIRNALQDAYLEPACIGLSSRFDTPDTRRRDEVVEHTRRFLDLAAAIGCRRLRVFGNDMPKAGADGGPAPDRDDVVRYVGEALRSLGEAAEPYGVDILLEMHGQFNYWQFSLRAVEHAGHPRVGLVYNCDLRDLVGGSCAATYERVKRLLRHVHMHAFTRGFPYPELFALLQRDGYQGYCSSEIDATEPTREDYLLMYAQLFRAWSALAAATGPAALPSYAVSAGIAATATSPARRA